MHGRYAVLLALWGTTFQNRFRRLEQPPQESTGSKRLRDFDSNSRHPAQGSAWLLASSLTKPAAPTTASRARVHATQGPGPWLTKPTHGLQQALWVRALQHSAPGSYHAQRDVSLYKDVQVKK